MGRVFVVVFASHGHSPQGQGRDRLLSKHAGNSARVWRFCPSRMVQLAHPVRLGQPGFVQHLRHPVYRWRLKPAECQSSGLVGCRLHYAPAWAGVHGNHALDNCRQAEQRSRTEAAIRRRSVGAVCCICARPGRVAYHLSRMVVQEVSRRRHRRHLCRVPCRADVGAMSHGRAHLNHRAFDRLFDYVAGFVPAALLYAGGVLPCGHSRRTYYEMDASYQTTSLRVPSGGLLVGDGLPAAAAAPDRLRLLDPQFSGRGAHHHRNVCEHRLLVAADRCAALQTARPEQSGHDIQPAPDMRIRRRAADQAARRLQFLLHRRGHGQGAGLQRNRRPGHPDGGLLLLLPPRGAHRNEPNGRTQLQGHHSPALARRWLVGAKGGVCHRHRGQLGVL
mmetsp:Transcript_14821/g.44286  ORF Transcript_14821/g.44286 Transcript_14821/m.44286 type:complete len:390 (+) Transcript_14821:496-1665(+)